MSRTRAHSLPDDVFFSPALSSLWDDDNNNNDDKFSKGSSNNDNNSTLVRQSHARLVSSSATITRDNNNNNRHTNNSRSSKIPNPPLTSSSQQQHILWSCCARNDVILAEAGEDVFDGSVADTARGLLARKPTPGYEYHSHSGTMGRGGPVRAILQLRQQQTQRRQQQQKQQQQQDQGHQQHHTQSKRNSNLHFADESDHDDNHVVPKLKGIKFHVYEHVVSDEPNNDGSSSNTVSKSAAVPIFRIWIFAAVYNADLCTQQQVQSFLEKIVTITEMWRDSDPTWKCGTTLAAQTTFAPILLQRMQEVTYLGKMAMITDHVERSRVAMQQNITLLLDREDRLLELQAESSHLQAMANQFQKRARKVRQMKKWQHAKHGLLMGTAVTAGVAIVIIPPLIAIL